MSIKFLAEDDRPREKFLLKGKSALSDSELLAIILGSGNTEESAVELSQRILKSVDNNWQKLSLLSVKDLMKFKGIGEAKAISIATALEIGRRKASQEIPEKIIITSSEQAYKLLLPHLTDLRNEEFWAVFLNQRNQILKISQISKGGITSAHVDVRILFKEALENFAVSIIIAHNHPTGVLKPSQDDIRMTKNIVDAGKILNIEILDHIIIGENSFVSFQEQNLL